MKTKTTPDQPRRRNPYVERQLNELTEVQKKAIRDGFANACFLNQIGIKLHIDRRLPGAYLATLPAAQRAST